MMNDTMTIQDANVAMLRTIDPERVYVAAVELECGVRCDSDYLHGKGVVAVWPEGQRCADTLCLACAMPVIEGWITSDVCDYVTVMVLR